MERVIVGVTIYHKEDFKLDIVLTFIFNNDIKAKVLFCPKTLETNETGK